MNEAIYGVFADIEDAERAISALKDHGAHGNEISVLRKDTGTGLPRVENAADHSLTPTSAGDVTAGALKGGAAGLALGILAGAVALTIPGIGPILAAGPLAAAFGATLASTAAGALGGGAVGYFVDQGVPEEAAHSYHSALDQGNILVVARAAGMSNSDAVLLMQKYGALSVSSHPVGGLMTRDEPGAVDSVAAMNSDASIALDAAETRERITGTPVTTAVTPLVPPADAPAQMPLLSGSPAPETTVTTTHTETTTTTTSSGGARSF